MICLQPQKNIFPKITSMLLLVGIILISFASYSVIAQTAPIQAQQISLESIIEIPKVDVEGKIFSDISRVDWWQTVTINGKSVVLNSDEALGVLNIPSDIKDLIKLYRTQNSLNDGLQFSIARKLIENGELPKNYLDLEAQGLVEPTVIIDAQNTQTLNSTNTVGIPEQSEIKVLGIETVELIEKGKVPNNGDQTTNVNPISVSDEAVSYLTSQQNADGSWGSGSTQFITTIAVLEALQAHGTTGTAFDQGIVWISTYFADNTDYFAEKLNIIIPAGEPNTSAEILVNDQNVSDGGFSFNDSYQSDPLTTAKAIQALFAAEYVDEGASPNHTLSLAFFYLINKQRSDDGWSVFDGGLSTIPVTTEVIEAMLPWKHLTMSSGSNTIEIDDTINPAVASLTNTQMTNGTWGNDILNTALAYHAVKAAGATPTHQLNTLEYFEDEQEGNGSFDNDIYKTAKVLKALSLSKNSGQLVVNDLVPGTALQTGATAQITIVVSNSGNTAVDSGVIHIVTDDYNFGSIDMAASNIVVNANSTKNITVEFPSTRNLLGNVVFKVFIEGTNGVVHSNSRYEEILTFAADPANRPALPIYYVAYKSVSATTGTPAITWRWPAKSDPNLNKYVLMFRPLGTTPWSGANVSYPATSATVGSLVADQIYEATIGTSSSTGSIYLFTPPVQIKTSANSSAYVAGTVSGKIKAIEGTVADVDMLGVTSGTNTTSGEDGSYTQNNVPWGSGYARVSNFRYENYINKYTNANINLTGVDVYTTLKLDIANPTVSNVLIVGESDKIIENGQTKLIQYTVADDIGDGGGIVQSASFYYYDLHNSGWHLIGTEQGLLSGTRTYAWNIPNTLTGAGYKIKVIVKDFAGKESAEVEWGGTFELTAACIPPATGDWIISTSCILNGTVKPPASVIVNAGKVLTLSPNSKLLIDLKNYKLLVKQTGGVLIKNTATLRQVKPSD